MPQLVPVDNDPFASAPQAAVKAAPQLVPVDNDPFAGSSQPSGTDMPDAPAGGTLEALNQGFLNGIPILGPMITGGGDRVAAGVRSLISGKSYDDELKHLQNYDQATAEANPVANTTGEIGGGLAAGVATAPLLGPALAGMSRMGGVGAGVLTGAGVGTADGFVRTGGDIEDRAKGALVSGGVGAAFGALAPIFSGAVGAGVRGISDLAAQASAMRGLGVSRPAANVLTRALEADGTLSGPGAVNIRATGNDAMLADAGPNAAAVLDTAMQRGGPGAVAARQSVEARAGRASSTLDSALDTALGPAQGAQTVTNNLRTSTAAARSTAYDAAYNSPIDYATGAGRSIESLMKRVPQAAITRANNLMTLEGHQSQQILINVLPDGSYTLKTMPDVRQLDYITRGLNDVAQRGDGQGALGGNTAEGRAYGNLSKAIRGTLRNAVPAYGTALDTAAEPIQARNALDFGTKMLSPSVARDEVADTMSGMSQAEVEHVRQGLRSKIDEALSNVRRTITDPNVDARQAMQGVKELSSDAARQKIGMILPPDDAQRLFTSLDRATRALELRSATARNSATYARQATSKTVEDATAPGFLGRLMQGEPLNAGKSAAQFVTGTRPQDRLAGQDRIYGELSKALTGPRGPDALDFFNKLQRAHAIRGTGAAVAGQVAPAIAGAVAGAGYQGIKQLIGK